ncbi:MAG: pilus assembly protein [bacterium]|nr:pilus assembly protein [bacterium]
MRIRSIALDAFREFACDTTGNIAVLFAIAAVPIITFVGAAIDYTRANSARSSMQAALDSASLMVSRDFNNGTITSSQISTKASDYFNALYHSKDAKNVAVTAAYTAPSGSTPASVKLTGTGSITTSFMKVAGFPTLPLNTSSTTSWGINKLRVALALDNTGSMNSGDKIGSLKTASKNLVTQLSALAKNNGDVYISVIPFALDVNVGTSNVGASWLRWDTWDPKNYSNSGTPWYTYCDNGYWLTMAQCTGRGYNWTHTVGSPSHSQWNGCVTDRDQSYDTKSTIPSSYSTYFVADQDQYCPVPLLPLTYSWTTINSTIDSMTAQGATNQTIGLQWAWLSLLQQNPLNAPAEPADGSTYQHIVVLFTDGLNTGDRWYGDLSSQSTSVDNRMKALCDNVKAGGVTLYTVQIDTDGAGQSAVLPYCASGSQNFFMLTDPSQINAAFAQIGTSISKLRVAK